MNRHVTGIKVDKRFLKSSLILCTETQIDLNETPDVDIDGFGSFINNVEHKFSSLCMYRKESIELTELYRSEGVLLLSLAHTQCSLKHLICYRKKIGPPVNSMSLFNT